MGSMLWYTRQASIPVAPLAALVKLPGGFPFQGIKRPGYVVRLHKTGSFFARYNPRQGRYLGATQNAAAVVYCL